MIFCARQKLWMQRKFNVTGFSTHLKRHYSYMSFNVIAFNVYQRLQMQQIKAWFLLVADISFSVYHILFCIHYFQHKTYKAIKRKEETHGVFSIDQIVSCTCQVRRFFRINIRRIVNVRVVKTRSGNFHGAFCNVKLRVPWRVSYPVLRIRTAYFIS